MATGYPSAATEANANAGLRGLALEYEKYDALTLAELVAKKQFSPVVRQYSGRHRNQ